jgi:hypothetical protein
MPQSFLCSSSVSRMMPMPFYSCRCLEESCCGLFRRRNKAAWLFTSTSGLSEQRVLSSQFCHHWCWEKTEPGVTCSRQYFFIHGGDRYPSEYCWLMCSALYIATAATCLSDISSPSCQRNGLLATGCQPRETRPGLPNTTSEYNGNPQKCPFAFCCHDWRFGLRNTTSE